MRCVIVVHPYFLAQRDTDLRSLLISRAQKYALTIHVFSPDLYKDKRVTLNKRQKNEISNSAAFIAEMNQVMWSLLTNTIPHGRTILYMVTSATAATMMAVEHFTMIFDPGKNGLQLTDEFVMRLTHEIASNDPNVIFSYVPFQDDDVNVNDKVNIIANTRHNQIWSERGVDPMLCNGDLAFFCNCATTFEGLRFWAHERTPGVPRNLEDLETVEFADVLGAIAEDHHLTRCAQVCFTGTEEDQAGEHDQGTIDEVLGDQDLEQGKDVLEEADREADLLEQISLPGHPESEKERLASWLRLLHRARVAIRRLQRNFRHLPREALVQMLRAARAPQDYINAARTFRGQGCDNTKPTPQTHKVSTPRYVQSRSGTRCVRDRRLSRRALFDLECCLHGNHLRSSMDCERVRDYWFSIISCMSTSLRAWLDIFSSTLVKNGVMIRLAGL